MKFSIVTPSFRQLDWLQLCISSIRDQANEGLASAYSALEVEHLVQDGGTPGIEEFARKSGANFYRDGQLLFEAPDRKSRSSLVIHSEADRGMYDAINRGLLKSSGEICAWLNSDEQYLPGALQSVADWFAKHRDVEWMFADAALIDESGGLISYRRTCRPSEAHIRLLHLNTLSCSTFFRRKLVEDGFLLDCHYRAIGDAEWVYRILRAGRKIGSLRELTSIFTFTGNNLGASSTSHAEADEWRRGQGAPPSWMTYPSEFLHRIRKTLAGAYRRRPVSVQIYTRTSGGVRAKTSAPSLGFHWPSTSQG